MAANETSTLAPTEQAVAARVFGTGLDIREIAPGSMLGFDVVLEPGPTGERDLRLAAGEDNLANDLKVALLTPTGTDPFNVTFGFDGLRALTQPFGRRLVGEFLRLSVVKTLGLDARIKQVLDVSLEPASPLERRWVVNVEAQTVLGDVIRLVLGEVETGG